MSGSPRYRVIQRIYVNSPKGAKIMNTMDARLMRAVEIEAEFGMSWMAACEKVFKACGNPVARSYAETGMMLYGAREQQRQALYILSNITHWRGEDARSCREFFKKYAALGDDA